MGYGGASGSDASAADDPDSCRDWKKAIGRWNRRQVMDPVHRRGAIEVPVARDGGAVGRDGIDRGETPAREVHTE